MSYNTHKYGNNGNLRTPQERMFEETLREGLEEAAAGKHVRLGVTPDCERYLLRELKTDERAQAAVFIADFYNVALGDVVNAFKLLGTTKKVEEVSEIADKYKLTLHQMMSKINGVSQRYGITLDNVICAFKKAETKEKAKEVLGIVKWIAKGTGIDPNQVLDAYIQKEFDYESTLTLLEEIPFAKGNLEDLTAPKGEVLMSELPVDVKALLHEEGILPQAFQCPQFRKEKLRVHARKLDPEEVLELAVECGTDTLDY
jgi:hypothetical protein